MFECKVEVADFVFVLATFTHTLVTRDRVLHEILSVVLRGDVKAIEEVTEDVVGDERIRQKAEHFYIPED